jgi:sensor histidine kinase regulating citrate/malate metabolism
MKEMIVAAVAFLLVIGMLFFSGLYHSTMTQQCKEIAMQKSYTPIEIQAVCGK